MLTTTSCPCYRYPPKECNVLHHAPWTDRIEKRPPSTKVSIHITHQQDWILTRDLVKQCKHLAPGCTVHLITVWGQVAVDYI